MRLIPQSLKTKFTFGDFARNVMTVATGTVIAQIILASSVLVLTRLYDPAAVGLLTTYLAIGTIVALAITGRYEQAIVLPKDDRDALDLARIAMVLATVGTFACLLLIIVSFRKLAQRLDTPQMEGWFFVLIVSIYLNALRTTLSFLLNRWKRYKGLSKSRVWNAVAAVILKLALFPLAQAGLLLGAVGGQFAGMGMLIKQARHDIPGNHPWRWANLKRVALAYRNFPLFMMPATLTDSVAMYLPLLGASFYFSPRTAGELGVAMGVLCLPAAVVGSAIAQVFYQECTITIQERQFRKVRNLLFQTWTRLFFAALLPMLAIYFYGPHIFNFLFGDKWPQAGLYASIMVPLFLSDLIRSPTASTFLTLGLQRTSFHFSLLTLCGRGLGLYIGYQNGNFAYGMSITVLLEVFLMAAFNARILWELKRRRVSDERADSLDTVAAV